MFDRILDYFDNKKKEKALKNFPWQYIDRKGNRWFNTTYRRSYNQLGKWC